MDRKFNLSCKSLVRNELRQGTTPISTVYLTQNIRATLTTFEQCARITLMCSKTTLMNIVRLYRGIPFASPVGQIATAMPNNILYLAALDPVKIRDNFSGKRKPICTGTTAH